MYEKWVDVLSNTLLFQEIQTKYLSPMLQCIRPKINDYDKQEYIALVGDEFKGVGIILSGTASVIKENAAGNRFIISLLGEGDIFGEMAVFSSLNEWPASVQAQEPVTALFIPGEKIVGNCPNACMGHKQLIMNMLTIISEKALLLNRKVDYLSIKSMRGKVCTYLLEQYKKNDSLIFMLPMNRNELADFLNVSRPSMSREMSRLRDEGVIDFYMSSIKIKDLEALKKMAE